MSDDLRPWPDPTPEMLGSPEFEAVWQCVKSWGINVPEVYAGYCGATGNHVRAILDALAPSAAVKAERARIADRLDACFEPTAPAIPIVGELTATALAIIQEARKS
jgi:hypothetical protein